MLSEHYAFRTMWCCMKVCGVQEMLQTSTNIRAGELRTGMVRTHAEDMTEGVKQPSIAPRAGVPLEIRWLVEFLVDHALDKVSWAFISNFLSIYTIHYGSNNSPILLLQ